MRNARLVAIIVLLLQHDKMSTARLAEQFAVTQRTIFRDIEVLNAAGVPIIGHPGVKGGIALGDYFRLENGVFTLADMMAVLQEYGCQPESSAEVLSTLARIKGMPELDRTIII